VLKIPHIVQTEKAIEVHADIPGVCKEDIHLDVEQDVLTLSVESKQEAKTEKKDEQGIKWHHSERSRSFFKRSLRMPESADMEAISASYTDGTLNVTVSKREVPPKNKRVAIA
jgi:HSP20 family protein